MNRQIEKMIYEKNEGRKQKQETHRDRETGIERFIQNKDQDRGKKMERKEGDPGENRNRNLQ